MMDAGNNLAPSEDIPFPQEPPAHQRAISRRTAIRRLGVLVGATVVGVELGIVALRELYPSQTAGFGGPITVGRKADFPAALPQACTLNVAGVFYRAEARAFLVHLSAETEFLLGGSTLDDALLSEDILRDGDGTYWIALYQACPHLGAMLAYQLGCRSFKCPSHGAHFHCDGEYLDGPSPRSMDRFPVRFASDNVVVDTDRLERSVEAPQAEARLLPPPPNACIVG